MIHTSLPPKFGDVDVIIAGGGTAGCILATRLADADPSLVILVVERGRSELASEVFHEGDDGNGYQADLKNDALRWFVSKNQFEGTKKYRTVGCANVLGGGSTVFNLMNGPPSRWDFESWEGSGWQAEDLIYSLQKRTDVASTIREAARMKSIPPMPIESQFMTSAAKRAGWVDAQHPSDIDSMNAIWRDSDQVPDQEQERKSAAAGHLLPRINKMTYPNFHVLVESFVQRVLIDENNKVTGVEVYSPAAQSNDEERSLTVIKARKLVVACSGVLGTPLLLEMSGIGDPSVLDRADIPVVVPLPGVGNGYRECPTLDYAYKTNLSPGQTTDAFTKGIMTKEDLYNNKHGLQDLKLNTVTGKVRPSEDEIEQFGPELRKVWDDHFKMHPGKATTEFQLSPCHPNPIISDGSPCMGITVLSSSPISTGCIHILEPFGENPIVFENGYFTGEGGSLDLKLHVWMYKKQREIFRRMPCYRGERPEMHPPFAADSPAACIETTEPLPEDVEDIAYTAEDDRVLEAYILQRAWGMWASIGTCKMLPTEKNGVVDAELGVHGITGLKIADLSIIPGNLSAYMHNQMALLIGEKAAEIILKKL
ncbi:alcohol oxidase [Periconia macrospinosa]|uniref:Alcohol oxidase n=1 Tax=Periconia macrospinosa TaxID=97972 RepID=A0A2V1DUM4_9PLEO|nr:alcohol oxidase [Periconia macrospinosa]